jgi:hypothetical protein
MDVDVIEARVGERGTLVEMFVGICPADHMLSDSVFVDELRRPLEVLVTNEWRVGAG